MNGEYYVAYDNDNDNKILGYICFGKSAQIPTLEKDMYIDETALDIGLGLNPTLCGNGFGSKFLADGISFAKLKFNASYYRLTVASFNQRAIKVYERVGFKYNMSVHHAVSNTIFHIMLYTTTCSTYKIRSNQIKNMPPRNH
jgi:RimJ/RimL family protein N-acetyltransferase